MSSIMTRFQQYGINQLSLCADSRAICPGDTFVALPGLAHDGRLSIEEALQKAPMLCFMKPQGLAGPLWIAFPRWVFLHCPLTCMRLKIALSRIWTRLP